jgi:hypothetical protein|nr:MAG TPA: hypothetical protein [Crassvirales sp.]
MRNIKRWWFKKKIHFLCNCIKQINKLYNKHCRKQRIPLLGEIDNITPEETRELWYLLQAVRDLEYDIWKVYHAIDDD